MILKIREEVISMIEAVTSTKIGFVNKANSKNNAVLSSQIVKQNSEKSFSESMNALGVLGKYNLSNLSFKGLMSPDRQVKNTPEILEIKTQLKSDINEVLKYGTKMLSDADKEVKSELPSMKKDILPLIEMAESGDLEVSTDFNKYLSKDLTTLVQYDKETGNTIKELFYTNRNGNISVYGYNEYQPDGTPKFLTASYENGDVELLKYDWPMDEVGDGRIVGGNMVKFNEDGKPMMYTQYGPFLSGMDMIKLDPETGKEILTVKYKDRYSMDFPSDMSKLPKNPKVEGLMSQVSMIKEGKPDLVINNEKDNYLRYCDRLGFISDFVKGDKSYKYHGFEKGYEYTEGDVVRYDISGIAIPS